MPSSSSCSVGSTCAGPGLAGARRPGARGQRRRPRPAGPRAGRRGRGGTRSARGRSTRPTCRPTSCSGSRPRVLAEDVVAAGAARDRAGAGRPRPWRTPLPAGRRPRARRPGPGRPGRARPAPGRRRTRRGRPRRPTSAGCWPTPGRPAASTSGARSWRGLAAAAGASTTGCPAAHRPRADRPARGRAGSARPGARRARPGRAAGPARRTPPRRSCPPRPRPRSPTWAAGSRPCSACYVPGRPAHRAAAPPRCGRWLADAPAAPARRTGAEHLDWVREHAERIGRGRSATLATLCTASPRPCCRATVRRSRRRRHGATLDLALRMMLARHARRRPSEEDDVSKRVLLHVGTPKTGTSYLQDVLFRNRRDPGASAGILYPADRFDAHFLAALDLMRLPWGGLEAEAVGAWDRLAGAGPRVGRHRDHQPRDPRDRLARPGRPRARLARPPGRRGPRRALGARPGPADPGRVAGERQAPRASSATARFLAGDPGPRPRGPDRHLVLGGPGDPRHPRPLGRDLPPERVHLVTVPPPGGPPDLLWERFSQAFGLDRPRPRPRGRARQPVARRARDRAAAPDQPSGPTTRSSRRATGRWSASCSPTRPCRGGSSSPRLTLPPDVAPLGPGADRRLDRRDQGARVRRDRRPRRPGRSPRPTPYADPDHPDEARGGRRGGRRDHGAAARERPAARAPSSELAGRARPDATATLERSYLRPTYRFAREGRAPARRQAAPGRGLLRGLPAGAGQELAVGVAADLPGDERRRRPCRRRRPRPGTRRPTVDASRLPATLVIRSEATSAATSRVEVGVVRRRGGQRHRRCGQLLLA